MSDKTTSPLIEQGTPPLPPQEQEDTTASQPEEENICSHPLDSIESATSSSTAETEDDPQGQDPDPATGEAVAEVTATDEDENQTLAMKEVESVRELILALHPTIVPDLVTGDSVAALIASIKPAEEAYSRIVNNMQIPAGGNLPVKPDIDSLPAFDKIRRGLSATPTRK